MYCQIFAKYINDAECDICDSRTGYDVGFWREVCRRDEYHPVLDGLKWWMKPKSLTFKLFICVRWITRRLPLKRRFMIWWNKDGLHLGFWKPNLEWTEPLELDE